MRARFRKGPERTFRVELTVHQLDSMPAIHRLLHIHWRARHATPSEGRTASKPVEAGNVVRWNTPIHFTITVPSDPSDPTLLLPAPLSLHLRSERRARWMTTTTHLNEGSFSVDLSDVAAVGFQSRNHLIQNSLLNTTLKLSIRVTHHAGDKIFKTVSTPTDDPEPATAPSSSSPLPRTHSLPHATPPAPPPPREPDASTTPFTFEAPDTPSSVLHASIPPVDRAQKHLFEEVFQTRLRDAWPAHIVASRVDAREAVAALYAVVCAQDGIGVGVTPVERTRSASGDDISTAPQKTLSLELLIESRDGAAPPAEPAAPVVARAVSGGSRSPRSMVRSNSMGEITSRSRSIE